ncbi:MAG: hydroxymethylglutaryl-CoA reductase, degradative [Deltaproteobacteria bacterium]|nr:hydroxymethylglutaryl-CoA reductase, degradative [Deltaproteobacteria bacterium]
MSQGGGKLPGRSSRMSGFYRLPLAERRAQLSAAMGAPGSDLGCLDDGGLDLDAANDLIENVIGTYSLPLGLGLNFVVNGRDYLVPMCVEEPSVVAAASNAARMVRSGGGFKADADPPIMIAQVELRDVPDLGRAEAAIAAATPRLLAEADLVIGKLVERGGGARAIVPRRLGPHELCIHLEIDCRDAMGANLVNGVAEALAPRLGELSQGRVGLRILSNLADRRRVRVRCRVPAAELAAGGLPGPEVVAAIAAASRFAELDPYRAATHNKGIMNGVDAVALAIGNDWRGIEAGAHAYAALSGRYRPLATWSAASGGAALEGQLEMPMAVGTVGGALRVHRGARLSLAILAADSAQEVAGVIGAVGLASNLAALRALATEGIQRGHMELHARSVARGVGAEGDLVARVAAELAHAGDFKPERAQAILDRLRMLNSTVSNPEVLK